MKLSAELKAFEARLGHRFASPALLIRALTHPSLTSPGRPSNQRMEFLGDRVLNLVIAEAVLNADPDAAEGTVAPRYNALVRKETCAEVALAIGLPEVLRLGRTHLQTGTRKMQATLGDAIEAVIAAVYLDAGLDAARAVVLRHWQSRIETVDADAKDPKTALQEWAQARGLPAPDYVETGREGPPHAPVFTIEARLTTGAHETASAPSKRRAEQAAARALLSRLETSDD